MPADHKVGARCDTDGSGDVSVQELQDGFIQMKTATKGLERILAFLEQTFAAADTDSGGTLDKEEFQTASTDRGPAQFSKKPNASENSFFGEYLIIGSSD